MKSSSRHTSQTESSIDSKITSGKIENYISDILYMLISFMNPVYLRWSKMEVKGTIELEQLLESKVPSQTAKHTQIVMSNKSLRTSFSKFTYIYHNGHLQSNIRHLRAK